MKEKTKEDIRGRVKEKEIDAKAPTHAYHVPETARIHVHEPVVCADGTRELPLQSHAIVVHHVLKRPNREVYGCI